MCRVARDYDDIAPSADGSLKTNTIRKLFALFAARICTAKMTPFQGTTSVPTTAARCPAVDILDLDAA